VFALLPALRARFNVKITPPKKPHWGATCLTCIGTRSLAYR
jgi:hypothetical protein